MDIIVTLAQTDYLKGASALYNSLIRNGFEGLFVIGFRNRSLLPSSVLRALEKRGSRVQLIELDTHLHFANYKPTFMQQVLTSYPDCTSITYMDPDIVLTSPCNWILSWCEGGPSACADVNWWMPSQHPTRRQWIKLTGLHVNHQLEIYFNGGFLSLRHEDRDFLKLWEHLIYQYGGTNNPLDGKGDLVNWRKGGRWLPFMSPDQDALNIALMTWEGSITALGPDEMGFAATGNIPHATGENKPWLRNFLIDALLGLPPRLSDKAYWSYAGHPIAVASKTTLWFKEIELSIASFIGRFYRKG